MTAIPSERARAGVICCTSRPATVSLPASGRSAPAMILIRVDFPAPFSPTIACTSPGRRSNDTPRSALTPSNDLLMEDADSREGGIRLHDERKGRKGRKDTLLFAIFACSAFVVGA